MRLLFVALGVTAAVEPFVHVDQPVAGAPKLQALERTEPVEPSKAVKASKPAKPFFPFFFPFYDPAKASEAIKKVVEDTSKTASDVAKKSAEGLKNLSGTPAMWWAAWCDEMVKRPPRHRTQGLRPLLSIRTPHSRRCIYAIRPMMMWWPWTWMWYMPWMWMRCRLWKWARAAMRALTYPLPASPPSPHSRANGTQHQLISKATPVAGRGCGSTRSCG